MVIRKLFGLIFLAFLLLSIASCASASSFSLPIDFSPGMPALPDGRISDREYQDDSIHVLLDQGVYEGTEYWTAHITIADASQLRTAAVDSFDSTRGRVAKGRVMARRVNAILAINGDYFSFYADGYLFRQGQMYRNLPSKRKVDVLLIDAAGDFHIVPSATEETLAPFANMDIVNTFNFGPALVIDGQPVTEFAFRRGDLSAMEERRQRMCFAQAGPLEYLCIATAGADRGSIGMTIREFAAFVYETFDVKHAYNLDGGDSTMMFFHAEKINDVQNASLRQLSDIIYFASAVADSNLNSCAGSKSAQ